MIPICCSQPSKSLSLRGKGFTDGLEGFRKSLIVALRLEGSLRSHGLAEASGVEGNPILFEFFFSADNGSSLLRDRCIFQTNSRRDFGHGLGLDPRMCSSPDGVFFTWEG